MVKYLKNLALLLVLAAQPLAFAEVLQDPTMPPLQMRTGEIVDTPTGPVLQSVTLGSKIKYAMISGQTVALGGKFENARLIGLKANEAVLQASDGSRQVLKMDFAIKKTPVKKTQVKETGLKKTIKN